MGSVDIKTDPSNAEWRAPAQAADASDWDEPENARVFDIVTDPDGKRYVDFGDGQRGLISETPNTGKPNERQADAKPRDSKPRISESEQRSKNLQDALKGKLKEVFNNKNASPLTAELIIRELVRDYVMDPSKRSATLQDREGGLETMLKGILDSEDLTKVEVGTKEETYLKYPGAKKGDKKTFEVSLPAKEGGKRSATVEIVPLVMPDGSVAKVFCESVKIN